MNKNIDEFDKQELLNRIACISYMFESLIVGHPSFVLYAREIDAVERSLSDLYQSFNRIKNTGATDKRQLPLSSNEKIEEILNLADRYAEDLAGSSESYFTDDKPRPDIKRKKLESVLRAALSSAPQGQAC